MALTDQARDLTIRTILGEAGGETPEGWQAVANVIRNRALSGRWGDPYNGGLTNTLTSPNQFSVWNPGNAAGVTARNAQPSDPAYQRIGAVVDGVFNGTMPDNTNGATHYYAPGGMKDGQPPSWAAQGSNQMTIGNHVFMTLPLSGGRGGPQPLAQQPPAAPQQPHPADVMDPSQPHPAAQQPAPSAPAAPITDISNLSTYNHGQLGGVQGFIFHHTGGRGTPQDIVNTLNGRGLGVQYVMDRDGSIYQTLPTGARGAHIMNSANTGMTNDNAMGMEVIANNDADVTPAQVAAARAFAGNLRMQYPGIQFYGHGEVNPGHKEATEGLTITNAVRADASGQPAAAPAATATAQPAAGAPAAGAPAAPATAQQPSQQVVQQQPSPFAGIAQAMLASTEAQPAPPPPMQPQYSMAAQAPIQTPGIQNPVPLAAGDPQAGTDQQAPGPLAPAGAKGFDPFRYRRQQAPVSPT